MTTLTTSSASQSLRKEKSKTGFNNSADWTAISEVVRREEARQAALKKSRGPAPKRGDVKAAIFKSVIDATWVCLCASPTYTDDTDAFLDFVPFPKKSQPMAKFWPLMDAPVL